MASLPRRGPEHHCGTQPQPQPCALAATAVVDAGMRFLVGWGRHEGTCRRCVYPLLLDTRTRPECTCPRAREAVRTLQRRCVENQSVVETRVGSWSINMCCTGFDCVICRRVAPRAVGSTRVLDSRAYESLGTQWSDEKEVAA